MTDFDQALKLLKKLPGCSNHPLWLEIQDFIKSHEGRESDITKLTCEYQELKTRTDGWRQLAHKHEQTICDLKYQLACAKAGVEPLGSLVTT